MTDDQDRPLFGPPNAPGANSQRVVVDGVYVGTLSLAPLKQLARPTDSGFVAKQIRDMAWLGLALVLLGGLLATWLSRHLLRPIAALRSVTQRIAQGELDARAPVLGRDELAQLAEHVNTMAQTLASTEQQRRRVLADVSHELRTPLTVIRGELEVLRLNQLVDDLYQLALADAGDLHYRFQPLELGALLLQVVERYRPRAAAARLTLEADLRGHPLHIAADRGRLTQVLANLLENSLRYTDAGGRIKLTLERQAGSALISVEDSAPGVPPAALERLFDRLYRADAARSREHGGSGLGLAICRALVLAHRGEISARASALGGICIVLRLPLATEEASP